MVEVGVSNENGIKASGVAGGGEAVEGFGLPPALVEACIDEDSGRGCFEEVGGSGDFPASSAEGGDLHGGMFGMIEAVGAGVQPLADGKEA